MKSSFPSWAAAVGAATFVAFLPALGSDFVSFDDGVNFLRNPRYRGFSAENLAWMFSDVKGHYMPVTWLTLALDYSLWGMDARGYHFTSLVLHVANALLFFRILEILLLRAGAADPVPRRAGAAGALLYAVHPLRVESVAWVTERRDLTSGVFFFLTILAYLRWTESRRPRWLAASVAAFAGMLLCKAMGMTLPLVLLVIDAFPLRRFSTEKPRSLLVEKIPFFVLLIAAVAATVVGQRIAGALYTRETYPLVHSFAQPGYRVSFYVLKTLVPWPLSPLYWFRPEIGWPQALGWIAVLGAGVAAIVRRRAWPAATAAWIAFVLLIAPVCGVFQAGPHFAADRYTYLACLPFAALAAAALLRASETRYARAAAAVSVAALAGLALLTAAQCLVWRDSVTLWTHALRVDPDLYLAYNNRGTAKSEKGDWTGAIEDYDRSIALRSDWAKPWFNRGVARAALGDPARAIEDFSRAVLLDPSHVDAIAGRAIARSKLGRSAEALADCGELLRLRPDAALGFATRGQVRFLLGDLPGAIADYTRALEIAPSPDVYGNRGLARVQAGQARDALADYTRSLELRPDHVETIVNRAVARSLAGDLPGALRDFDDALRLKPGPAIYLSRATARGMAGDFEGAIADCSEAIRRNPGHAPAYARRGMARLERRDPAGAAQDFEKALELAPPGWPQRPQIEALLADLRRKGP